MQRSVAVRIKLEWRVAGTCICLTFWSFDAHAAQISVFKTIRRISNALQSKLTTRICAVDSRLLNKRQYWLQCTNNIVINSINPTEPMTNCQIRNTHRLLIEPNQYHRAVCRVYSLLPFRLTPHFICMRCCNRSCLSHHQHYWAVTSASTVSSAVLVANNKSIQGIIRQRSIENTL